MKKNERRLIELYKVIEQLQADIEFMAKQVERGLFDKTTTAENALNNIFYYPNTPWNLPQGWQWDVSHKEYAKEFNKKLNRDKK